jgi:CPA2 family monovalent cation:H+ antiporter-2
MVRNTRYSLLRGFFHGEGDAAAYAAERRQLRLHSVALTQGAYAVGRTLAELDLTAVGASVTRVRRRGSHAGEPAPDTRFEAGDVVVLLGEADSLAAAEIRLLQGMKWWTPGAPTLRVGRCPHRYTNFDWR